MLGAAGIARQRSARPPLVPLDDGHIPSDASGWQEAARGPSGADRVLVALKLLAGHPEGVSLEVFARELKAPKSTTHRVLATLRRADLVAQDDRGQYHLAMELVRLAIEYYESLDVRDVVDPTLRELARRVGETASYAVLEGPDVVIMARTAGSGRLNASRSIGERMPAHATSIGKALLAHSLTDQAAVRAFVARYGPLPRLTAATLVTVGELQRELAGIREQGYATDREENEIGVVGLGYPVFLDLPTRPSGAISVSAVAQRTSLEELAATAPQIAAIIREHLGAEALPDPLGTPA